jgi:hypothetical protein
VSENRPRVLEVKPRSLGIQTQVSEFGLGSRNSFSKFFCGFFFSRVSEFKPRSLGIRTWVSEFRTRVSDLKARPRVLTSAEGDRPRLWEIGLGSRPRPWEEPRVSASADGDEPRVSASTDGDKPRVSTSVVGGIYTPHSQRVSFAPQIFCRVTRDFSRNFSFGIATLGIFLHKMRTSASKQNTIHNYNSYKRSQEPEVWQLRGARSW